MKTKTKRKIIPAFLRNLFSLIFRKIQTSLRLQLIVIFLICILASIISIVISSMFLVDRSPNHSYIDYRYGIDQIESTANQFVHNVTYGEVPDQSGTIESIEMVQNLITSYEYKRYKIMFIDQAGDIRAKSANVIENSVDMKHLLFNSINTLVEQKRDGYDERQEYTTLRPIMIKDQYYYIIVRGIPEASQVYYYSNSGEGPLPFIIGIIVFFVLFYYLTKRKMRIIEDVAGGLLEISKGNLKYRLQEKSKDELGTLATYINRMAEELEQQIERERAAEKTKNELITNVSHDLRTPLTLIMGYLRALQDNKYENEAQAEEYLNIAYDKSEKLKSLLEDLFEYTKLNNAGVLIKKEVVSINELLEQLLEEYVPICEENHLGLKRDIPMERVSVNIDANQMVRVFENLLNNAISYSIRPSLIRVNMKVTDHHVLIQFRNNSQTIPEGDLGRMFERFYRVDSARTSKTGGSGLGLAIAKSIISLHDGDIWAEADEDTVTISVKLHRYTS